MRISRSGRRLWRLACELAERHAGSPLSPAQVLELVAAEAASGGPRAIEAPSPPDRAAHEARRDLPASPAFENAASDRNPELARIFAEFRTDPEAAKDAGIDWSIQTSPSSVEAAHFDDARQRMHDLLKRVAEDENLPLLVPSRRAASPADRLEAASDPYERREPGFVDARMRELGAVLQRGDAELARLLRDALDFGLHRTRGFDSFESYVDDTLDFSSRTAWTLIAIDRAATRIGGDFAGAYREGRITLLAARALLRVISPIHARAWIERAGAVTLRRLEAEITWALDRRDAATGGASFEPAAPPPLDARLSSFDDLLDANQLQMRAQGEPDPATWSAGGHASMRVDLCIVVPVSIAELTEEAMMALRRGSESRGEAFERMLAVVLLEWMIAGRHRDPVFERDGWRCAVPACSSRRNLHDHHIRFRSDGGGNERENRITVCAAHHLHGIHMGRIRATGTAPSNIRWEMGCSGTGSRPHATFVGDRYLVRPATCSSSPAAAVPNKVGSIPMPARKIA